MDDDTIDVTYLELRHRPPPAPVHGGAERQAVERLDVEAYLALYRRVGGPLRWDQRLRMPAIELERLLGSGRLRVHVLRDAGGAALGLCEFDLGGFPEVELKNFGLVPEAQGRGLGPWLLASALAEEWRSAPDRIWLHTDTWDHPAAVSVYQRAGFRIYAVRRESPEDL